MSFRIERLEDRQLFAVAAPNLEVSTGRLIFSQAEGTISGSQWVTVTNTGKSALTFSDVALAGADAGEFAISKRRMPPSLAPGASGNIKVAFEPRAAGVFGATVRIASDDPDTPVLLINLRGLGTGGRFETAEPSLQRILDTYQIPVNVGDSNPATSVIENLGKGEELGIPMFMKAGTGPVRITPIAAFSWEWSPVAEFGWYRPRGDRDLRPMFTIPQGQEQTLAPVANGTTTFDPGGLTFGLYSRWPIEPHGTVYSEDAMNTWDTSDDNQHKVRVYPYRKVSGKLVTTSFIVAIEEAFNSDFQDAVLIVENVKRYDAIDGPSNLAAIATSPTSIQLTWDDRSDNEVCFVIERSGRKSGTYAVIGSVPPGTTVFEDTTVEAGKTYFYHVRAVHKSGHYALSNRAATTTPPV